MQDGISRESTASDDDEDLFCLDCGYNLRGLLGDPKQCPECSSLSAVDDLRIPAALVEAQGRKLGALPWTCVGWMLIALWIGVPLFWLSRPITVLVVLLSTLGWGATSLAFRRVCGGRQGWAVVLAEFHIVALFATGFIFLVSASFPSGPQPGSWRFVAVITAAVGMLAMAALLHRDAERRLARVRRRAAVELAKREWEWRMIGPWKRKRR